MALKTDYKDYRFQSGQSLRRYREVNNGDGTVSFEDMTPYAQVGDRIGASDLNTINSEINTVVATQQIVLTTNWENNNQIVGLEGITAEDSPILDVKTQGTIEEMEQQISEWSKVLKAETQEGAIKFTCKEPTEIELAIIVKGK